MCFGSLCSAPSLGIGFRVLLEQLENFRLADGTPAPEYAPNALLHGLTGLHLAFDPR